MERSRMSTVVTNDWSHLKRSNADTGTGRWTLIHRNRMSTLTFFENPRDRC